MGLFDAFGPPKSVNQLASKTDNQLASKTARTPPTDNQLVSTRRSGVLAGKLAAGVSDLLASNPKAPAELQELASKSLNNQLASNPNLAAELKRLHAFVHQPLLRPLPPTNEKQRKGGRARAANLSPERRREIALMGVAARRKKRKVPLGFQQS